MNEEAYRVRFERPRLAELARDGAVVDMHFHSRLSDGRDDAAAIAARARELGIGVAVTDHNAVATALELDRFEDLLSIPGIELTSWEGTHLLVYFYDARSLLRFFRRHVEPFRGAEVMSSLSLGLASLLERARDFETLVVFPHPYCGNYTGVQNPLFDEGERAAFFKQVDGIEAINAENLNRWNLKSALLGFNLGKALTGGSDGHRRARLGRAVTVAACPSNRRAFLDAVKEGRARVVGKEVDLLRKVTENGARLRTGIRHAPDLVGKNLRFLNATSRRLCDSVQRSLAGRLRTAERRGA
ncbi:MAG: PHP-associated domain-containing protein [Desulfobacterales bacterium]